MNLQQRLESMYLDALAESADNTLESAFYQAKREGLKIMDKLKTRQLTLRLPEDLHKRFKLLCVAKDIDMNDTACHLIAAFVDSEETKQEEVKTTK